MLAFNILVMVSLLYVAILFAVAFLAERRAARHGAGWLRSPLVYTLSLSIYCTAWTFYGAVGYAARSGMEYVTIYIGPSLVVLGWWWMLRKLVRIGRRQRITSIADLIASRYGKSPVPGVIVTVIAVAGITPYIALQLQSITLSFDVFAQASGADRTGGSVALGSAMGLALFTILFGTRNLDANERHHGVVMAIAVEAVVKLAALVAVGIFVVWGIGGGLSGTLARIDASPVVLWDQSGARWIGLIFVAAAAFLCLPRMFHVLVVENADDRQLSTASWAFPLYVMAMSLFVVPIAVIGLERMPAGSNPDAFVLTLPLHEGANGLAMLSFLGGFSSATSMVIVATIALATMVSNHIVAPLWLAAKLNDDGPRVTGDMRSVVLNARRAAIGGLLGLGYVYYRVTGGGAALSSIGLIAFAGLIQILPAMIGGLYWRGANRFGATAGLSVGFAVWLWTLFLPSFGAGALIPVGVMENGPMGIAWLRPQALFGATAGDPLMHAVFWSLVLNTAAFVTVSLVTFPSPVERLQGAQFVNVFDHDPGAKSWTQSAATAEDLLAMTQRILGTAEAQEMFLRMTAAQGRVGYLPEVTPAFLGDLERELAGSVGSATAHAMIGQIAQGVAVSVEDLIAVADEAAQILEYSSQLEAKSQEQERTARALRDANDKLTRLSHQKDAFLSQISHELRTPMTSIRSFSEILRAGGLTADQTERYAGIIEAEAQRLTRLLDDLLDLSVMENGQVQVTRQLGTLRETIDRAVTASGGIEGLGILRNPAEEGFLLHTDLDRLAQVFINLIANARKYCDAAQPELRIETRRVGGRRVVDFIDNGSGIPPEHQEVIFEKFTRLSDPGRAGGAGLGLAICREIMERLGGGVTYLPGQGGGAFRVTLPALDRAETAAAAH